MKTAVLCGMPEELHVLRSALPRDALILSGTDKLNLGRLVASDFTRIISAGLCGGLAPGLPVGAVVCASSVRDHGSRVDVPSPKWNVDIQRAAQARNIVVQDVPYYSSGLFDESDTKVQRSKLYIHTGAKAMDDETRYVCALAAARKISFGVLRVVSDDWRETLPVEATGAIMNKDGTKNIQFLLHNLAERPGDIPDLLKIAQDFALSLRVLGEVFSAVRDVL